MRLLIAGAGGHGRVVADAAIAGGEFASLAFLDDRPLGSATAEGWRIVGPLGRLEELRGEFDCFVAAFGDADLRLDVLGRAIGAGFHCPPIVHPAAIVSKHCSVADGTVVIAGACINVGVKIGTACIVNTGATVDHDCVLAEGVHICPGAHLAGKVEIGSRSWFGIGAVARQGIRIGAGVTVGAGAVVVKDVPDNATVMGNPATESRRSAGRLRAAPGADV